MARIFISFFNGITNEDDLEAMPCFYETLISELENCGNDLLVYPHKKPCREWGDIPSNLLSKISEFAPDIIFLCNNDFYPIDQYFECPIVVYEVDSPLLYSNKVHLAKRHRKYKFFVTQKSSVELLERQYGVNSSNILCLPFFTSIKAEKTPQTTNISFIGSKFTNNLRITTINEFMRSQPENHEVVAFKNAIKYFAEHPFSKRTDIIKALEISSKKVIDHLNTAELLRTLSDNKRIQTLSIVSDLGLKLYGTRNWISDLFYEDDLTLSFQNKSIYSVKHNQDIYNSSKLAININHIQAQQGFSWRVADIMASNACLVAEYKQDMEILFPQVGIPLFYNKYEARELCQKLLADESRRLNVVAKCQEAVEKTCRFHIVWQQAEEFTHTSMLSEKNRPKGAVTFLITDKEEQKDIMLSDKHTNNIKKIKNKVYYLVWEILDQKLKRKGLI